MKCNTWTWRQIWRRGWVIPVLALLAGCAGPTHTHLNEATDAYQQRRYEAAYQSAARLTGAPGEAGDQAAYLAGLAAEQLGRLDTAERYFQRAARSGDDTLAADALASLGLLRHRQGRYRAAADALERAGRHLVGEQRANAYFYAGVAQQKLDRGARARTNFVLAREATDNTTLHQRIEQHLAITGYTVQVGAFGDRDNAQRLADRYARLADQLNLAPPRLVATTDDAGRSLTLVQVGRFGSYRTAQRARQRLGAQQSLVVPIISQ